MRVWPAVSAIRREGDGRKTFTSTRQHRRWCTDALFNVETARAMTPASHRTPAMPMNIHRRHRAFHVNIDAEDRAPAAIALHDRCIRRR